MSEQPGPLLSVKIVTIFPELVSGALDYSIVGLARERGLVEVIVRNLRDFTTDRHQVTDDYPFGGGAGMVMKVEPLVAAVEALQAEGPDSPVIFFTPQGEPLKQALVQELAEQPSLILICGRYEGVDERFRQGWVTREISLGDYVLSGGEFPALVLVEAMVRLLPGALGNEASSQEESFTSGLLDYPHYTRPREFRGRMVPEVLLSGHHENIRRWRRKQALRRTRERRPDLLAKANLGEEDAELLAELEEEDDAWT